MCAIGFSVMINLLDWRTFTIAFIVGKGAKVDKLIVLFTFCTRNGSEKAAAHTRNGCGHSHSQHTMLYSFTRQRKIKVNSCVITKHTHTSKAVNSITHSYIVWVKITMFDVFPTRFAPYIISADGNLSTYHDIREFEYGKGKEQKWKLKRYLIFRRSFLSLLLCSGAIKIMNLLSNQRERKVKQNENVLYFFCCWRVLFLVILLFGREQHSN